MGNSEKWGGRRVLNPLPPESQSGALPGELRPPLTGLTPKRPTLHSREDSRKVVGVERFELPTSCSQSRRATRLRYTPIILSVEKVTRVQEGALYPRGTAKSTPVSQCSVFVFIRPCARRMGPRTCQLPHCSYRLPRRHRVPSAVSSSAIPAAVSFSRIASARA